VSDGRFCDVVLYIVVICDGAVFLPGVLCGREVDLRERCGRRFRLLWA
jgi:hypothetical protein